MVGLGRIELPTSPLSGVRSSQLSYRPGGLPKAGGAGRDRTGDLLSANQALSQLSYSPLLAASVLPFSNPAQNTTARSAAHKAESWSLMADRFFQSRPVGCRDRESSPRPL